MQVHQAIPYGLLYSVTPQAFVKMNLRESAIHDEFEWEDVHDHHGETVATSTATHRDELNG
jgi:hypothetical protein